MYIAERHSPDEATLINTTCERLVTNRNIHIVFNLAFTTGMSRAAAMFVAVAVHSSDEL